MAQAAQQIAAPNVRETPERETVLRDTMKPIPLSWPRRFLRTLTKGELLIVPVGHKGDEKTEYAQRWPAQAIASTVISAMAIVVMASITIFSNYNSTTREDAKAFTQLEKDMIRLEGDNKLLREQLQTMKEGRTEDQKDIKVLKVALGLDIADGTRIDKTPKER